MMRFFEQSNNEPDCLFLLKSEEKQNGFFIGFQQLPHGGTKTIFITYNETGEEMTHESLVTKLSQDTLDGISQAARKGYDSLIEKLKSYNTPNDRFCDHVKWGVFHVEKAHNKQNFHARLSLS